MRTQGVPAPVPEPAPADVDQTLGSELESSLPLTATTENKEDV